MQSPSEGKTMDSYIGTRDGKTVSFNGPDGVAIFEAIALKTALWGYAKFKMQPNRHYTPTRMLRAATRITGRPFKRGQYAEAAQSLAEWIETARAAIETREG
jgi:hypothetical protein